MPDGSMQIPNKFTGRQASRMPRGGGLLCGKSFCGISKSSQILALVFLAATALLAKDPPGKLELKTMAFRAGGRIPTQFTCSGADISPALSWNQPPPRTQSFALIVDDPDAPAGTWVHWVVYNLPASARQLPEHVLLGDAVAGGGKQGLNDFHQNGYGGPCPPPGKPHRYFFRLYALDTLLDLRAPVHRKDVDAAMKGHILVQAEWMGTFGR
jgi:Raf kinase inhibitor-like YbhB/YbcL family protein